MESLGKLKDDFLLRKFEDDNTNSDSALDFDKYSNTSLGDPSGEVSTSNY